jgi:hypothetical protein
MEKIRIRDKHPGSAILLVGERPESVTFSLSKKLISGKPFFNVLGTTYLLLVLRILRVDIRIDIRLGGQGLK